MIFGSLEKEIQFNSKYFFLLLQLYRMFCVCRGLLIDLLNGCREAVIDFF